MLNLTVLLLRNFRAAKHACCSQDTGVLLQGQSDQGLKLTSHLRLVTMLRVKVAVILLPLCVFMRYEACPESKDTKVLNLHNIFNLQSDTVNELPVHNFIFQHNRRHCPNIY